MTDTRKILERQAAWQKGRAALTWAEKVRMAEAVRDSLAQFRESRSPMTSGVAASGRFGRGIGRATRKQKDK